MISLPRPLVCKELLTGWSKAHFAQKNGFCSTWPSGYSGLCCAALGPVVVERCLTQEGGQCLLRVDFGPVHHHFWCILLTRTSHRFWLNSTGEDIDSMPPWENWEGDSQSIHKHFLLQAPPPLHSRINHYVLTAVLWKALADTLLFSYSLMCIYTVVAWMWHAPYRLLFEHLLPSFEHYFENCSTCLVEVCPGKWTFDGYRTALFLVLSQYVNGIPMRCSQSQVQPRQP